MRGADEKEMAVVEVAVEKCNASRSRAMAATILVNYDEAVRPWQLRFPSASHFLILQSKPKLGGALHKTHDDLFLLLDDVILKAGNARVWDTGCLRVTRLR